MLLMKKCHTEWSSLYAFPMNPSQYRAGTVFNFLRKDIDYDIASSTLYLLFIYARVRNPLTSSPLDSVPSCVWGKKSYFFPPLAKIDLGTLTGHEELIDGLCTVSIRYWTVPVVSALMCIL